MKVFLRYSFIFDPSQTWTNNYNFDNDLASYFRSMGYEAEVVKNGLERGDEVMIYLNRVEESPVPQAPASTKPQSVAQNLQRLRQGRTPEGKFKP